MLFDVLTYLGQCISSTLRTTFHVLSTDDVLSMDRIYLCCAFFTERDTMSLLLLVSMTLSTDDSINNICLGIDLSELM